MVMRYLGGVNSPSYNPLAANVTTGTTVVQDGGVYTVASAAQANGRTQWVNDPFFSSDTILLQADNFANASQNNTFLDSSKNNFAVTRAGNTTQGAFNPFSQPNGYWSNYFDGTGDYLTVADNAAFEPGTGEFCVELWFYPLATSGTPVITTKRAVAATTGTPFQIYIASNAVNVGFSTTGNLNVGIANLGVISVGQWNHVAGYRIGNAWYAALNGVVTVVNANNTGSLNNNANAIVIGGDTNSNYFNGYVSNYRFVVGSSVYTSSSFTPPTVPLTAITNTQLLTCQSNRLVDNSANNFTITKAGDTSVNLFTPFNAPVPGQYPAIQWGASMSFNGTNQYLTFPSNTNTDLASSDFTIESFFYLNSASNHTGWFVNGNSSNYAAVRVQFESAQTTLFVSTNGVSWAINTSVTTAVPPVNSWFHVAVVRDSTSIRMYINGVQVLSSTAVTAGTSLLVGTDNRVGAIPAALFFLGGNVSNFRIIKGTALYTGTSFTPPTQPLTAVTNTQLLTCQGSAVDLSTNNFTITNNNAVTASTSGPFTIPGSTGSMYFDGTGDYLTLTGSSNLAFGTGDFTIECWFSLNALPVSPAGSFIYDSRPTADGAYPCLFVVPTTNVLTYYVSTAARITGTTAIRTREWNYVVVSRVSGSTRLFLNGVQQGSTYTDATNYLNGASRPVIANNGLNLGGPLTGYISNLRVLKGTGFTSVTLPTAPLTAITNTQLLLNGTNAGIYDASARTAVETVGNAQVTTQIKKYGSGSMAFDGTGDWLLVPNSSDLNFGTGDFTVECWLNMTNTTTTRHLIGKGTATTGWALYFNAAPTLFIFEYAGSISYSSNYNLIPGQWYHLAIVRSGLGSNNFKMFINGFLIHEATITNDLTTTSNMYVGASRTATNSMFGYIDDLRISKFARYTGPFIPPAVAMQDQG